MKIVLVIFAFEKIVSHPTLRDSAHLLKQSRGGDWVLWLLRRRRLFRVSGVSMQPTLKPGTLVFIDESAYIHSLPAPRDIVIARHPYQRNLNMLKRVQSVDKEGRCFLISDNPTEGTDSRTFGAIRVDRIIGKVTSLAITTAD